MNITSAFPVSITVAGAAFGEDTGSREPKLAIFEVDEAFLAKLEHLFKLCNDNSLSEVRCKHDVTWGFGPMGITNTEVQDNAELVVLPDGSFWFHVNLQDAGFYEAYSMTVPEVREKLHSAIPGQFVVLTDDAKPYPSITYVSNTCGEATENESDALRAAYPALEELFTIIPFEDGPGSVLPYIVELDGMPFVMGNREFAYNAKAWGDATLPSGVDVATACKAYVDALRSRAAVDHVVFPLDTDDEPDRCVISVALPFQDADTLESITQRLAAAMGDFKEILQLYSTTA